MTDDHAQYKERQLWCPTPMSFPVDKIGRHLPHAGRMVLIERVIFSNASTIRCLCHDPRDPLHPLRQGGILPVTAGIEYAAQAAALHAASGRQSNRPATGHLAILQNIQWSTDRLDLIDSDIEIIADQVSALPIGLHYRFCLNAGEHELMAGGIIIALGTEQG